MTLFLSENDAARLGIAGAKKRQKRHAPDAGPVVRTARGEGDRVKDLMTLAARGWVRTSYVHSTGAHFMTNAAGTHSPVFPSYRAMLDTMLQEVTQ